MPNLVNCIKVAASTDRYAIIRDPVGWHRVPTLLHHLIAQVLSTLHPSSVLIIQYLDVILFSEAGHGTQISVQFQV